MFGVTSNLQLKLLGIPKLYWEGSLLATPTPRLLAMLCYLAVHEDPITRQELAELFWEAGKAESVRRALSDLRRMPYSEAWLRSDRHFVSIQAQSDVKSFKQAMQRKDYVEALSIWQKRSEEDRTFLKALELRGANNFKLWLEQERQNLQDMYLEALQARLAELQEANDVESALNIAHQLLKEDALSEDAHKAIMLLEHFRGNTDAAIEQFEVYRQTLRAEFELEPSEGMLELLEQLGKGGNVQAKSALWLKQPKDVQDVPSLPQKLIGRDALLAEVLTLLPDKQVLLHGFAGTGKTALAATVAAQHLQKDKSIVWLRVGSDDLGSLLDALARPFGAQQELSQSSEATKPSTLKKFFQRHDISLLVLDDVWNAYALSKLLETVPESTALLVTSRQRYPRLKRVDIGQLKREDSLALLGFFAQQEFSSNAYANELCEHLADHAFALHIAGVHLVSETPEKLLKDIREFPHILKMPAEFAETNRESVANLLEVSLENLSDRAYEAFLAMGTLFTPSCTPELLNLCLEREIGVVEDALMELAQRALAERVTEAGSDVITYRLHDLAFSFAKANKNLRRATLLKACFEFIREHYEHFEEMEAEIGNVLGGLETLRDQGQDEVLVDLMYLLTTEGNAYYAARGHTPRSLKLLEITVEIAQQEGQLDKAHYLSTKLGNAFRELLGDFKRALEFYELALELARKTSNSSREAVLLALIGVVHFDGGLGEEDDYFNQAYNLANSLKDDLALAHVLQNMSHIALEKGNYAQVKPFCVKAVEVTERLRGSSGTAKARADNYLFYSLLNLGIAMGKLSDFESAIEKLQQALQLAQKSDNQLWEAYALQEIAGVHHNSGQRDMAKEYHLKAIELYERNNAYADLEVVRHFMKTEGYFE